MPSWRSGSTHGFCVTGGHPPIASEPTPSPRLWATAPGATPVRLCEHTTRVRSRPSKTGTFYLAGNRNFLFGSDKPFDLGSRPEPLTLLSRSRSATMGTDDRFSCHRANREGRGTAAHPGRSTGRPVRRRHPQPLARHLQTVDRDQHDGFRGQRYRCRAGHGKAAARCRISRSRRKSSRPE
jgi:hypothetical protein